MRIALAVVWAVLLCPCGTTHAYIDQPGGKLTLPKLMQEFHLIEVVKVAAVDLEKGYVVWEPIERLRDDPPPKSETEPATTRPANGTVRHLLKLNGEVPRSLCELKVGQDAVLMSRDGYYRTLVHIDNCWYCEVYEKPTSRWLMAYTDTHYDFNLCFTGSNARLVEAIRTLQKGDPVTVDCRIAAQHPETQTVRYNPKKIEEKTIVTKPATQPS